MNGGKATKERTKLVLTQTVKYLGLKGAILIAFLPNGQIEVSGVGLPEIVPISKSLRTFLENSLPSVSMKRPGS
jgi:hypothetical protein